MSQANQKAESGDNLSRERRHVDMSDKAIAERMNLVWQLTVEEWAKKGIDVANRPMRKDVERLIRLSDKQ